MEWEVFYLSFSDDCLNCLLLAGHHIFCDSFLMSRYGDCWHQNCLILNLCSINLAARFFVRSQSVLNSAFDLLPNKSVICLISQLRTSSPSRLGTCGIVTISATAGHFRSFSKFSPSIVVYPISVSKINTTIVLDLRVMSLASDSGSCITFNFCTLPGRMTHKSFLSTWMSRASSSPST